jgi:Putative DNA-binding domain
MNDKLIEQLLNEDESTYLDFKRDQYPFEGETDDVKSEVLKDILAFTNAWRRTDAYILIGVEEVRGGRSKVVGVHRHLDDHSLQQFVNSKTKSPITFSYTAYSFQGSQIGVINIPIQDRPAYLIKDYGRLRKNIVYVRRGSSTAEAGPDEISKMGAAYVLERQGPVLQLQFADFEKRKRLGASISLESVVVEISESEIPGPSSVYSFSLNPDYYTEKAKWISDTSILNPVGFALENVGSTLASNPRLEMKIMKESHLVVLDDMDYPKHPQRDRFITQPYFPSNSEVFVDSREDKWIISAKFDSIQPKAIVGSMGVFYIGALKSCRLDLEAKVFADNLADPEKVPLAIDIVAAGRKVTRAELTGQGE